jgi:outer membrane protein OmpA-like peptidoglycan-associated protein/uncharacterized membrane protein (UPF0127 family)
MAMAWQRAWLRKRGEDTPVDIQVAGSFWARFVGLMFRRSLDSGCGLLLKRCSSVHTAWMRFSIDVLYLDQRGLVVGVRHDVKPWRASSITAKERRAAAGCIDALELPAGTASQWQIDVGDQLVLKPQTSEVPAPAMAMRQRGAAMVEFAVVGPLLILIGLASVQYGLIYNAKNVINHASFMGARAGAMANAKIETVRNSYIRAMVPLYGGGRNAQEIAASLARATQDFALNSRIELLNPTRESFDDWHDPRLQSVLNTNGKRVIPNRHLARNLGDRAALVALGNSRDIQDIGGSVVKNQSGQSLADANMLKIRVTHGYEPGVPLMGMIYTKFLKWMDTGQDAFATALLNQGRIPMVSHVMVQMHTDAIEGSNISAPGMGNNGQPQDPGPPPQTTEPPPQCVTMGCSDIPESTDPGGGGDDGTGECTTSDCPSCPIKPSEVSLPSDILFEFNQAELLPAGKQELDRVIDQAKAATRDGQSFDGLTVIGHTDQLGTDAVNDPLSLRRAQAVADYLRSNGFPGQNIRVEGRGSREPVVQMASCASLTGTAQQDCLAPNRRVVLKFPDAQ